MTDVDGVGAHGEARRQDSRDERLARLEREVEDLRSRRIADRRRVIVISAALIALVASPFAIARTGDLLREGQRNPSSGSATRETQVISGVRGERYGTRQSNVSTGADAGGAAIYGCRRAARECTRHVNLSTGPAAAFVTRGPVPFTVPSNATGLVANLNAERVGGLTAQQLRGAAGAPGPAGPTGPAGPPGPTGEPGPSPGSDVPSGTTMRGVFRVSGQGTGGAIAGKGVSFPFPLGAEPVPNVIDAGDPSTPECPGTIAAPAAAPGQLCVYERFASAAVSGRTVGNPTTNSSPGASRFGFYVQAQLGTAATDTNFAWVGTWAVTAP